MSINVTVSGNPVSIKRGKMVTSDPYTTKKEFEKRRLLRLEQVRQQSKELAEGVRNKVRKEKKKQIGEIEKEGRVKLKSWQNRKLMELQNQYREALDEIGVGHKEAEELGNESDIFAKEQFKNEETAQNRGKQAETMLQIQKNKENYKKAMPIQHKKLVRDIENTRATLVSCMKNNNKCQKKIKKPKMSADINITVPEDSDFEEQTPSDSVGNLSSIQEEDNDDSEGFSECLECSDDKTSPAEKTLTKEDYDSEVVQHKTDTNKCKTKKTTDQPSQDTEKTESKKSYQVALDDRRQLIEDFRNRSRDVPQDTRISDRIKRRQQMIAEPDFCDEACKPMPIPENNRIRERIVSRPCFEKIDEVPYKDPLELSDDCVCCKCHTTSRLKSTAVQTELGEGNNRQNKCSCGPGKECRQTQNSANFGRSRSSDFPRQRESKSLENGYRPEAVSLQQINREIAGPPGDIPSKPSVKLKVQKKSGIVETQPSMATSNPYKVRRYDIPNRYEGEFPSTVNVEKNYQPETIPSQQINRKIAGPTGDIPSKLSVKLKVQKPSGMMETQPSMATSNPYKVRRYDFPNRYEGAIPSTSNVEKITAESIEVIPNSDSEAEWHEKMKQRDREAQMRGKRALEKERVQRDYEEMMKKLPILQRKEHIAQIGTDKPEYHMSEDRLKQRERERQNRLENAYAQAIPELRPQIITIPRRKHEIPLTDEPFEILDGDDARTLNLGKWDTETVPKKMFSAEEVQDIIKAFTIQKPEDRKTKLKQLLRSLKLQKEQLIQEIQALPQDDSINALLSDLNSFSDSDENRKSSNRKKRDSDKDKSEKKRRREDSDASNTSEDRKTKGTDRHKDKRGKTPSKKVKKSKPKVLVLQNTSTQTTPKVDKEKVSSSTTISTETSSGGSSSNVVTCNKCHAPCNCNKRGECESEEVCKIVIKLNEDDLPKVEVVRRGVKDKGGVSKAADVQRDKSPKSPRKKKERTSKSPGKDKIYTKLPEKESTKSAGDKLVVSEVDKEPVLKSKKPVRRSDQDKNQSRSRKSNESWKEHLSKNSMSTSSTSYMSPPDFSKLDTASTEAGKESFFNLRKKPQQKNVDRSSPVRIPHQGTHDRNISKKGNLVSGIKRLLSMSKFSVEELAVSSSEVQTPSQSIIEMETNNPMASLHNVIKFINVRTAQLVNELSASTDGTPVPPNSEVSEYESQLNVPQDESQHLPEKDTNGSSLSDTKEQIASRYTDVTDSCSKRIAHLAALIEELRQEKMRILQSPPVTHTAAQSYPYDQPLPYDRGVCDQGPCNVPRADHDEVEGEQTPEIVKDYSTRYYDLPPPSSEKSKGTDSTASMDEVELNRRLLEIDMSLAAKLKKFSEPKDDDKSAESSGNQSARSSQDMFVPLGLEEVMSVPPPNLYSGEGMFNVQSHDSLDQTTKDFAARLKQLMHDKSATEDPKSNKKKDKEQAVLPLSKKKVDPLPGPKTILCSDVPYVPLLVNIPKLPILEPEPEGGTLEYSLEGGKRHPPPSKGLITAKKFNGNISLVPHELSTIVEADSQVSTKVSPNTSRTGLSFRDTNVPLTPTPEEEMSAVASEHKSNENVTPVSENRSESQKTSPEKSEKTPLPSKRDHGTKKTHSYKCSDASESSKGLTCNEATCTSLISTASSFQKSTTSSSSDMESIEAMLRSIGMDWAIPTLHKTQEALALTSTSSSGDLSSKRKGSGQRSITISEVSLKDFLKKQVAGSMEKVISSSSLRSDASPASFIQECSEFSAIQANSSAERMRQRTSTPVLSSKSTSKTKDDQQQLFTGASDISSVRNSSCEGKCNKAPEKRSFHSLGSDGELSKTWE